MDEISKVFKNINYRAKIYLHSTFCSPWHATTDHPNKSTFHLIAYGSCRLVTESGACYVLNAGDLIFFTSNEKHEIENSSSDVEISTTLVCGHYVFNAKDKHVFQALPSIIHIKANELESMPWFLMLFKLMVKEADSNSAGNQVVMDKLAEVLLVYFIRNQLDNHNEDSHNKIKPGLIRGLTDPAIARVLSELHDNLGKNWHLEELASVAAMSRTAFAQKFLNLVGETPMKYLSYWRLKKAEQVLTDTQLPIISVALDCGYSTEASFIKAFKKHKGLTPGQWRKSQ